MEKLFNVLLALLIGTALAILMMEWFVGCGETYIDSKGERHKYACIRNTGSLPLDRPDRGICCPGTR